MSPIKPILDSQSSSSAKLSAAAKAHLDIIEKRRFRWCLNYRLLWISVAVLGLLLIICTVSYQRNSRKTADTFLAKAKQSATEGRYSEQATWLNRYSMLQPDNIDAIAETALAANSAADFAAMDARPAAVVEARKYLGNAIGRLGTEHQEKKAELRKLLINRLLQIGGLWFRDAESEVIRLSADPDDPQAHKWMALALVGQVQDDFYGDRSLRELAESADYWTQLSNQKPGEVLLKAIDLNASDVYLLENLVRLFADYPDQFEAGDGDKKTRADRLERRVEKRLKKIEGNLDSRSLLIRYSFDFSRGRSSDAIKTLTAVAEQARQRLETSAVSGTDSARKPNKGSVLASVVGEGPAELWDFSLLAEVAIRISGQDNELAQQYFDLLINFPPAGMSQSALETIYMLYGRLAFSQGDRNRAIDIWKQGVDKLGSNSIGLHGAIAQLLVEPDDTVKSDSSEIENAVERFRDSIKVASKRLAVTSVKEMMQSSRAAMARDIETAEWRLNILDAKLNARSGNTQKAISILEFAVNSQVKIEDVERIGAARQLALLHQQNGALDSAALAIERAVALDPGNAELRAQLAATWNQAGNHQRAFDQWKIVGQSGSIILGVAYSEAVFNHQLRLPPSDQNFSEVRTSIDSLRNKIEQNRSKELSENERASLQRASSLLDRIEILLPPPGVSVAQYLDSPELAQAVATLAEKHSDDALFQEFAAQRLALSGDVAKCDEALARLGKLLGESSTSVVTIRANVYAAQGKFREACQILLEQVGQDPLNSENLLQAVAFYALRADDLDLAYETLLSIPELDRSPSTLFKLAGIAEQLPENSKIVLGQKVSPTELAERWKSELKKREGDEGAFWRAWEATHLIQDLRSDASKIAVDDPRLLKARSLVRECLSRRPRWGEALSLEGQLSAIEGKYGQAIEQLKRGIASGDRRLATQHLLWGQLVAAGRDAEAEEAIRLAELSSNQPVDTNSAMQIQLALRQGDLERSLKMARDAVKERPSDFIAHLTLAKVAIVVAQKTANSDVRNDRFQEAQKAIGIAESIAGGDEIAILSASLSLELAKDDPDAVRLQVERINASKLGEFDRLVLMSRGLYEIKDYKETLPLLVRADALRHSSESQLALAQVYRQLNQPNQEIEATRKAQQLAPTNMSLRQTLAQLLATRGGEIDWRELESLLQGTGDANNTNRLLHAILLGSRGDANKSARAMSILREVVEEKNTNSNDAARILAALLQKQISEQTRNASELPEDAKRRESAIEEIKSLYESLAQLGSPGSVDLYRYADFLLNNGQPEDMVRIEKLLEALQITKDGTFAALEIGVRYAEKMGNRDQSPEIVSKWAGGEIGNGILKEAEVSAIAGGSLVKLGFVEEGLEWLDRAYLADPKMLGSYVVTLNRIGREKVALSICFEHHQKHGDAESLVLLAETILNSPPEMVTDKYRDLLDKTVREKMKNPKSEDALFFEGVATWRMQQREFEQAVQLYHMIDELAPRRIRTLNNLAMAYSELPGREIGGIKPIERALKLAGEIPELLDTYGVVLLSAGKLKQAEEIFQKAIKGQPDEPRFQFHLICTLLESDKESEAKELWKTLDLKILDPSALTPSEIKKLDRMKVDLAPEVRTVTEGQNSQ